MNHHINKGLLSLFAVLFVLLLGASLTGRYANSANYLVLAAGEPATPTHLSTANGNLDPQSLRPMGDEAVSAATNGTTFNLDIVDGTGFRNPRLKTVGDINGDAQTDLIAGGSSGLVWYENPNWTKHTISTLGGFTTDGEVADIDKDGDNDIVYLFLDEIGWLENPSWTKHVIDTPKLHDVELSDFDGDGDIDIAARNVDRSGATLHLYQQNSPTLWTHREIAIDQGEGLEVADIDNDSDEDIVINGTWLENTKDILNGSWAQHNYTSSWTENDTFISVGDVNGDGRQDIVLSPAESAGQSYRISWFEAPANPKDNNWTEHVIDNDVEAVHHFVGAADFDKDGDLDVASAEMEQGTNPDEVKIYWNENGSGTSWNKGVIATTGSHSMRIVDVDNDGDMDLYGANWEGEQRIELYRNLYEGSACIPGLDSWERHVVDSNKPWTSLFITSADVDGDGQMDIITGGWWYQNPGSPDGNWARNVIGSPLNNMALVYDFDGDGNVDILGTEGEGSRSNPNFVWAHNTGSGSFDILTNVEAGDGDFLQGADIGVLGSGENPKAVLSWHVGGKGIQTLEVPSDPTVETWNWSRISPISQNEAVSLGDIDRDNDLDILLGTIWLENQNGTWTDHLIHDTSGASAGESNPDRNLLADINQDGRLDAVVGYEAVSKSGKLAWYEQGASAGATWNEHVIANIVGPMSLDVVDMDKDGDLDVVAGEHNLNSPATAKLYVFENVDGEGNQWRQVIVSEGDEHHDGAQTVDIDGDGDLDIVSIGWGHNRVLLYENQSCTGGGQPVSTQYLPLTIGWNMISGYIDPQTPDLETLLAPIEDDMAIMKNGAGEEVYGPAFSSNDIGGWNLRDGYQIYMNNAATLSLAGDVVDPTQMSLDLPAGWSLIPYLRESQMPVTQALESISSELVIAKNGSGQVYWPDIDVNEIDDLVPGQGYKIYLRSPGTLTYPLTGSVPTPTNTPTPPTPGSGGIAIYVSTSPDTGGVVNGLAYEDEDILKHDPETNTWSMFFDGSDVGLGVSAHQDVLSFHILDDSSILFSIGLNTTVPDVGMVDNSDIIRFTPTSLGSDTAGSIELYFDGSDVGLSDSSEGIDALTMLPDGDLLISTKGNGNVGEISFEDQDLVRFSPTSLGNNTAGTWSLYFEGSDVGLRASVTQDIGGVSIDGDSGEVYLNLLESFSLPGATGDGDDVVACLPGSLGQSTSCTFSTEWDGSAHGLSGGIVDGISVR